MGKSGQEDGYSKSVFPPALAGRTHPGMLLHECDREAVQESTPAKALQIAGALDQGLLPKPECARARAQRCEKAGGALMNYRAFRLMNTAAPGDGRTPAGLGNRPLNPASSHRRTSLENSGTGGSLENRARERRR